MSETKEVFKQIYIPGVSIKGSFMEFNGTLDNGNCYAGDPFEVFIERSDFTPEEAEDYHRYSIILTRVARRKLSNLLKSKDAKP